MTLTMPTRELVGLLGDVWRFADADDENPTWHRVVVRWDGARLHAMAGDGMRLAWMSWGPNDGDDVPLPGLGYSGPDSSWELAILPENAKEIAAKFKVSPKDGESPLRVVGSVDSLRVERDATEVGAVALTSNALSRPWDNAAPRIDEFIGQIADRHRAAPPRTKIAYSGFALADFCNPKVVRQRGAVVLHFGPSSTYIEIGQHFRGAIVQDSTSDRDG